MADGEEDTIRVPLSFAQWIGGGAIVATLSAGGGYIGSAGGTSPDVFALQLSQIEDRVQELQTDITRLSSDVQASGVDRYTGTQASRDMSEIKERLRRLESQHPEIYRK